MKVFFFKEKWFLERLLWSKVFLGSEWVQGKGILRLTCLAGGGVWSIFCGYALCSVPPTALGGGGTAVLVLVLYVWLKWQLMFEHLMCTRSYAELYLLPFT